MKFVFAYWGHYWVTNFCYQTKFHRFNLVQGPIFIYWQIACFFPCWYNLLYICVTVLQPDEHDVEWSRKPVHLQQLPRAPAPWRPRLEGQLWRQQEMKKEPQKDTPKPTSRIAQFSRDTTYCKDRPMKQFYVPQSITFRILNCDENTCNTFCCSRSFNAGLNQIEIDKKSLDFPVWL